MPQLGPGGHLREQPALATCLHKMEAATCGCMEITKVSFGGFVIIRDVGASFRGNVFLSFYVVFLLFSFYTQDAPV